ncbi:hypothetical protein FZEAL_3478 [Fusarium zealandicum]|uniref:Uncharacterized protein n=1 Tax=Fusarium zealandicum TaxID=1053134 RepID=A0A8H4UNL6_9HYPO|nr:hypothetical protein FZEAL_3478 [Fusarium zealandicum]
MRQQSAFQPQTTLNDSEINPPSATLSQDNRANTQMTDTVRIPDQLNPQLQYSLDNLQTLCISAPDVPSPQNEHRTTMTIQHNNVHKTPAPHWPQDIWLHSPSCRVLYQPVLVVPHPPAVAAAASSSSPPLQPTKVPDAPPCAEAVRPDGAASPKGSA